MSSEKTCKDCGNPLKWSPWTFWEKGEYACEKKECPNLLCVKCHSKHPLFVVPDGEPVDLNHGSMIKLCKECFERTSTLDFEKTYDRVQGDSGCIFVFVHGGSGSRAMFHAHAMELQKRFRHASILLDLPGHGSLVETPLTLDSCVKTMGSVLHECGISAHSPEKIVYVGGSLGAYAGFHLLDMFKGIFDGAVLMDCGQNVGPGASLHARIGLAFLWWCGRNLSNATLTNLMLDVSKKSTADYKLVETVFGAGMFFDQACEQVECLKSVAPAEYIPNIPFPVLYMNGSKDYRDSEDKWLELSPNKESELKVYEGGDHFFIHDKRFVNDILTRLDSFTKKL